MRVSLLVSVAANGVIGRDGNQDWHISGDLKRLKSLTMGHHIVMGRKTYEAIGRPLPGRVNIVLTRQKSFQAVGCRIAESLEQAFGWATDSGETETFVLGGGQVYRQALPLADSVYMTRLNDPFSGDTMFPELDSGWGVTLQEDHSDEQPHGYRYLIYQRKTDDPLWEPVLARRELYRGGYLRLEELTIGLPDGRQGVREIVRVRDAVAVLPVRRDGVVRLVRQHRAAIGKTLLEAPAGVVEKGEALEATARRECREEVGLDPRRLTRLTTYAHAEGYSTGFITLYIGEDLEEVESPGLDNTEFLERVDLPFDELLAMVERGDILDSKTILTTLYWREMIKLRRE